MITGLLDDQSLAGHILSEHPFLMVDESPPLILLRSAQQDAPSDVQLVALPQAQEIDA
jgi:hypothetical protein